MTIRFPRTLLVLISCGALVKPASAQQIENVVDAPFTATFSRTTPGQPKRTCLIARASNGNVYLGCSGVDGRLSSVEISDVPNNRQISFLLPPPNTPDHTYRLSTPRVARSTVSAEDVRALLRRGQGFCVGSEHPSVALGERSNDGLTLFGFRSEQIYKDGSKRVTEYWESDLGVVVSRKDLGPQVGEEHSYVVTNVRQEEPNPSLFQIPKEYISDPLLEAKTVYIENLTGAPEVLDGALMELELWKRPPKVSYVKPLTVVNEKSVVDLTATFTRVPVIDASGKEVPSKEGSAGDGAGKPGIRLEVFTRDSLDTVFQVTLLLERDSVDDRKLIAMQCLNALWNRLSSTRVGFQPQRPGSGLKAQGTQ